MKIPRLLFCMFAVLLAAMPARGADTNVERDFEIALTKGQYAIELKDYATAIDELKRALKLKPGDQAARVSLGIAYLRSGDLKEANHILTEAVAADPKDARARYEHALVLEKLGQQEQARAQMAMAAKGNDPEVIAEAKGFLEGGEKKPFFARLAGGLQYDSNVILEQDSAVAPGVKNADWRYLLTADLGSAFLHTGKLDLEADYEFYGTLHHELKDYNVEQHVGRLDAKYALSNTTKADLEYDFFYTSLHGDHYNTTHHFGFLLSSSFTPESLTSVHAAYESKRFFDTPVSPGAPDRNGTNAALGLTHTIMLGKKAGIAFDYTFDDNSAEVDSWSYLGNKVAVNALAEWGVIRAFGLLSYYDRSYDSVAAAVEKRQDKVQEYAAGLTWKAGRDWSVTLSDDYTFNDSNIPVFKYTRNIVSLIAEIRL